MLGKDCKVKIINFEVEDRMKTNYYFIKNILDYYQHSIFNQVAIQSLTILCLHVFPDKF